jgi:hypothetical protein
MSSEKSCWSIGSASKVQRETYHANVLPRYHEHSTDDGGDTDDGKHSTHGYTMSAAGVTGSCNRAQHTNTTANRGAHTDTMTS